MADEDYRFEFDNDNGGEENKREKRKEKRKRKKKSVKVDSSEFDEDACSNDEASRESIEGKAAEESLECGDEKEARKRKSVEADKRGVCYLSRIPPHMDPFKLRQLLSQLGNIERIYLAPQNPDAHVRRKPGGRRRQDQAFSEGWVEFSDKRVAKRVANMLNGEQIGGRKRSPFYYDLWNIKYLSKFKWDDLTDEIAYKHAIREQKLALEISAAKKERDFYLSRVDKAHALTSIEERLKKKQKLQEESGIEADVPVVQAPKIVRKFAQKKPVAHNSAEAKRGLSKDVLAGVFGGS